MAGGEIVPAAELISPAGQFDLHLGIVVRLLPNCANRSSVVVEPVASTYEAGIDVADACKMRIAHRERKKGIEVPR